MGRRLDMLFHPWFAPQTYEIGWVFDKSYHEQGYSTEAAVTLLEYGFETLQLHRVKDNPGYPRLTV